MIYHIFQIVLNEQFKLSILTHGISRIKILILPFFISWIIEIKFNCVVAGGDGFHIPVNETQRLNIIDVVHVQDTKQENEQNQGEG